MAECIMITFEGSPDGRQNVTVEYKPETSEWSVHDRMLAQELALHALAQKTVMERQVQGLPVPDALSHVVAAHTFRELM